MRPSPLTFLLVAAASSGCAGRLETTVARRASSDFGCPEMQVAVTPETGGGLSGRYRASGCGHEGGYVAQCSLFGICQAHDEQAYAAMQAAAPSPDPGPSYAAAESSSDGATDPTPSASTSAPAPAPAPATPQTVSVSLRNGCPSTVKLFFGDKPKFGSGRYTSLGSNTVTSYSMREGDMLWIVDDSQNGIGSVSVSNASRSFEITSSCTGFAPR
jgi:hypothetical protein